MGMAEGVIPIQATLGKMSAFSSVKVLKGAYDPANDPGMGGGGGDTGGATDLGDKFQGDSRTNKPPSSDGGTVTVSPEPGGDTGQTGQPPQQPPYYPPDETQPQCQPGCFYSYMSRECKCPESNEPPTTTTTTKPPTTGGTTGGTKPPTSGGGMGGGG